eukprot:364479-Chlamydomonas_euryale.AAC.13
MCGLPPISLVHREKAAGSGLPLCGALVLARDEVVQVWHVVVGRVVAAHTCRAAAMLACTTRHAAPLAAALPRQSASLRQARLHQVRHAAAIVIHRRHRHRRRRHLCPRQRRRLVAGRTHHAREDLVGGRRARRRSAGAGTADAAAAGVAAARAAARLTRHAEHGADHHCAAVATARANRHRQRRRKRERAKRGARLRPLRLLAAWRLAWRATAAVGAAHRARHVMPGWRACRHLVHRARHHGVQQQQVASVQKSLNLCGAAAAAARHGTYSSRRIATVCL